MARRTMKSLAAAVALDFCLAMPLAGTSSEAFAFGGGGHFGGFGGGGHFGGFGGGHFGGFGGGHFGGFGHYGGMHFGGMRFGGYHAFGRHFGGYHFARHFGGAHFGRAASLGHFGRSGATHALAHVGLAHNAFAHTGLAHNAFTHVALTHNAFGSLRGWNTWNRFGTFGWNGGWWVGPIFWPYFYGDLLSFVLWPDFFYDPFDYGPDYLFAGLFWPGPYYDYAYDWDAYPYNMYGYAGGSSYAGGTEPPHHYARTIPNQNAPREMQASAAGDTCAALAPGVGDLPIDKIERAIQPSADQTALISDLKAASAKANDILRSSCPAQVPLTPIGRLDAMGKRIDATKQALNIVREPMTKFYDSLGDLQKLRFDAIALRQRRAPQQAANAGDTADLCKQRAKDFTNLPIESIEETVKPTGKQSVELATLKDASAKAASDVEAACPTSTPQTLADRFNAMDRRLHAMAGAVKAVQPALKGFYDSLSDEQKAAFNLMTPPQSAQRG